MADPRFFRAKGPVTIAELCRLTGAEVDPAASAELLERRLDDVAPIDTAEPQHLSFLSNLNYAAAFRATRAGAVLVHPDLASQTPAETVALVTREPYMAFARAAQYFHPLDSSDGDIATTAIIEQGVTLGEAVSLGHYAVIGRDAQIGAGTVIGANSVIGPGVVIGSNCLIGANVTVSHALIGDRVTLFPGARIGQDGFGFASGPKGHTRIPQLGRVIIGDDVEVGANSTIDRGAGPDTIIGSGSMIDNLVQIAHNVVLGKNCVIVAQAGIAGSSKLGDFVVVGGQAAIVGHLDIGNGAKVAGQSGITRDVPAGATMGGSPAVPMRQWLRQTAILARLVKKEGK